MNARRLARRLRREWALLGGSAGALLSLTRRYVPVCPPMQEMTALERAQRAERVEGATRWLEDLGTDWWSDDDVADWVAELESLGREMPIPLRLTPPEEERCTR